MPNMMQLSNILYNMEVQILCLLYKITLSYCNWKKKKKKKKKKTKYMFYLIYT